MFVRNSPSLSWAANNTAKLGGSADGREAWTLLSTAAYGKQNKVPQEAVPKAKAEEVTNCMLQEFAKARQRPTRPTFTPTGRF